MVHERVVQHNTIMLLNWIIVDRDVYPKRASDKVAQVLVVNLVDRIYTWWMVVNLVDIRIVLIPQT